MSLYYGRKSINKAQQTSDASLWLMEWSGHCPLRGRCPKPIVIEVHGGLAKRTDRSTNRLSYRYARLHLVRKHAIALFFSKILISLGPADRWTDGPTDYSSIHLFIYLSYFVLTMIRYKPSLSLRLKEVLLRKSSPSASSCDVCHWLTQSHLDSFRETG